MPKSACAQQMQKNLIIRCSDEAGVEEFLSLVKYAECVITNSFHGMIFGVTEVYLTDDQAKKDELEEYK